MKKVVVSAVNFNEGGPLSVLKDCLSSFKKIYRDKNLDITVFVHKTSLVQEYLNDFTIIEYPAIKSSWIKRLYFEYYESKAISTRMSVDLWISLHDITPNVVCKQVVYCHNPSPFYKFKLKDAFTDTTFFLFCLFYRFLYGINIKKNRFVIVQQQWIREEFEKMFDVKTIVSYPFFKESQTEENAIISNSTIERKFIFFFPAFPRVAKNFETLLAATRKLSFKRKDFELILTIGGTENKYAKNLFENFKDVEQIKFEGIKTRAQIYEIYKSIDCLVFPSKLETWGLPISEFKKFNKPLLLPDLSYAHETLGDFRSAKFFDPDSPDQLSKYMDLLLDSKLVFDINSQINPDEPFFKTWDDLNLFLSSEV